MAIKDKNDVTVNQETAASAKDLLKNIPFPALVRINENDVDDGSETVKFYKNLGFNIARFSIGNGLPPHLYAIYPAESAEEAKTITRFFDNAVRSETRRKARTEAHETSYEAFTEAGIDPADGAYADPERHQVPDLSQCKKNDPAEIVAMKIVYEALQEEYLSLTDEKKKRMYRMIAVGESERKVAAELDIAQTTLNGQKKKMLDEIRKDMKDYKD